MIAYAKKWLDNLRIRKEAERAFHKSCLGEAELTAVRQAHPVGFYTPNFFVRIGLAILTFVIVFFTTAIMGLASHVGSIKGAGALGIFQGLLAYAVLERIVRNKHHYQSGVDDTLLTFTLVFLAGGLNALGNFSSLGNAIIIFLLSLYLLLRFADRLVAVVATISFAAIVYLSYTKLGDTAKATAPLLVMAVFAGIYFLVAWLRKDEARKYYFSCLTIIAAAALAGCYAAGNYFLVRESGNALYRLGLKPEQGIPLGWLFWFFTIVLPPLYLVAGTRNKNRLLLRAGIFLSAATVLTIRHYYHFLSAETALCIAGSLLTAIAYLLLRRLKTPRQGFVAAEQEADEQAGPRDAEALAIGITAIVPQHHSGSDNRGFGGGSGGGGGATGAY